MRYFHLFHRAGPYRAARALGAPYLCFLWFVFFPGFSAHAAPSSQSNQSHAMTALLRTHARAMDSYVGCSTHCIDALLVGHTDTPTPRSNTVLTPELGFKHPEQARGAEFCCKTWLPDQEAVLQHPFSGQPLVFWGSGSHVTRIGSSGTGERRTNTVQTPF